ncbi:NAD(P)/FAD-dependent oxidoreductase [Chitinibacter bivalviorum]|uniref:NAD(P)/FAD-dependent oxidoreductase n=1 Tax=Chitinibacter bivalviorum TaxID=2739434 RepID=A0A7H9BHQ2_9NEIS|nr:NAD(P)/FAD-dependent oxidoreductase [Chitinibacter bivalviorum]QLG88253.1 NAD(P)/FAD-dependent oxidoreductase [Chitinibacter bivalviorum]
MQETDVVIIGAGAAGLMCAATAGQRGRRVVLVDHSTKLAEKIRISGGGRCNFTNLNIHPDCYLSNNPHFVKSALKQYTQHDFIAMVYKHGLSFHEKTLGQLFCDQNSEGIIQMLKDEVEQGDVIWRMGTSVLSVAQGESGGFIVETSQETWHCQSLVIASGGLSIPQIGATPMGYEIAKQFGLKIVPQAPALVPLTFQAEDLWAELAGVAIEDAIVSCKTQQFREAILFTHKGVSGPAILQISSYWQAGDTIEIDLIPDLDLQDYFANASREALLSTILSDVLPKRFVQVWLQKLGEIKPLKQYSPKVLQGLEAELHAWQVKPSGTVGYKKAEVTRGGVDTDELLSKTMMSRNVAGLYFIGEVVDVTGWLGGYNFQWAWSSGYVAGMNI